MPHIRVLAGSRVGRSEISTEDIRKARAYDYLRYEGFELLLEKSARQSASAKPKPKPTLRSVARKLLNIPEKQEEFDRGAITEMIQQAAMVQDDIVRQIRERRIRREIEETYRLRIAELVELQKYGRPLRWIP